MKKTIRVLPVNHFPTRPPILLTGVAYMALDIYKAPGWLWGVAATFGALAWLGWAVSAWREEQKPLAGYGSQE